MIGADALRPSDPRALTSPRATRAAGSLPGDPGSAGAPSPHAPTGEPVTERPPRGLELYGRYASLGMQFAATIGLFAWAGWWLDGKLGTRPIALIVGVLLGFVGGLVSLVHKVPPPRGRRREDAGRAPGADGPDPPSSR